MHVRAQLDQLYYNQQGNDTGCTSIDVLFDLGRQNGILVDEETGYDQLIEFLNRNGYEFEEVSRGWVCLERLEPGGGPADIANMMPEPGPSELDADAADAATKHWPFRR